MTPAAHDSVLRSVGRDLLSDMIRVRILEERCAQLYGEEKIRGFLHLYIGEEAVAAGVLRHLNDADVVLATYREHGHALLRGISADSIMAEMFGKAEGCSGGRGGSMHLFDAQRRFYGGNAIVGGHLPVAVGLALAEQMRETDAVVACFFGEGAVAEGEFHESMNLAALWDLPVLFVCENNFYAMGTSLVSSEAQTDLALKASAYEMPAWTVDGMDAIASYTATGRAVTSIRAGGGPVFLEMQTYRFRAHSMFDPELYRGADEVERWRERDPIESLATRLESSGLLAADDRAEIESAAEAEIDAAIAFAEAGSLESVDDLGRHVYRRQVMS